MILKLAKPIFIKKYFQLENQVEPHQGPYQTKVEGPHELQRQ